MGKSYVVYLLASRHHGTLYCGLTSDLVRRVWEHRAGTYCGFTCKYGVHRLVWFEGHTDVHGAIAREKRIKRWRRAWKINLIEERNRDWNDLYPSLLGMTPREFDAAEAGTVVIPVSQSEDRDP